MTVEITGAVPIPPKKPGRKGQTKYPFNTMEVNDSFFVPDANPSSLQSMARRATRERGWRWTARGVTERGKKGARCWRVA